MHELSIAHSLVELAGDAAARAGVSCVSVVHLRLGALAGVVREALEFGFAVAADGTPLAGARLEIVELPVRVFCPRCQAEADLPDIQRFCCPACGMPTGQVVQGRELELAALEYEDEPAGAVAYGSASVHIESMDWMDRKMGRSTDFADYTD